MSDAPMTPEEVWAALLAVTPLAALDLSNVTDATPWPLMTEPTTGEKHAPYWHMYGG